MQTLDLGKAKIYKTPVFRITAWSNSYLSFLWTTSTTLPTPFIPARIRLSQNILSSSGVATVKLQPMKQAAAERRMQSLQLIYKSCNSVKRIIHRAILWNRRTRVRSWTVTILVYNPCLDPLCPQLWQSRRVVNLIPREKKESQLTPGYRLNPAKNTALRKHIPA